jgi:uncharacterized protein (TIGR03067 family)
VKEGNGHFANVGGKPMRLRPLIVITVLHTMASSVTCAGGAKSDELQGVWKAESIVRSGKKAPPSEVEGIQFAFTGNKLTVKGNTNPGSEDVCTYVIDTTKSPKTLDIHGPKNRINNPMLCIYSVDGDELKVCYRKTSSGRPDSFTSTKDSGNTIIVFKRERPDKTA